MRNKILALLLLVAIAAPAHAAFLTATFGDQNSAKQSRLQADTDGVLTLGQNTAFANMSTVSGPIVALSASNTILTAANIMKNSIFQASVSGSYTLDSGTNMSTAIVPVANETVPFVVSNPTTGTVTLVAGSGFTLAGSITVPTLTTRTIYGTYLTTNSWTAN